MKLTILVIMYCACLAHIIPKNEHVYVIFLQNVSTFLFRMMSCIFQSLLFNCFPPFWYATPSFNDSINSQWIKKKSCVTKPKAVKWISCWLKLKLNGYTTIFNTKYELAKITFSSCVLFKGFFTAALSICGTWKYLLITGNHACCMSE